MSFRRSHTCTHTCTEAHSRVALQSHAALGTVLGALMHMRARACRYTRVHTDRETDGGCGTSRAACANCSSVDCSSVGPSMCLCVCVSCVCVCVYTAAERIGVFAEPEVITRPLTSHNPFIVLASDGVWEFLPSQSVVDMVSMCVCACVSGGGASTRACQHGHRLARRHRPRAARQAPVQKSAHSTFRQHPHALRTPPPFHSCAHTHTHTRRYPSSMTPTRRV